MVELFFIISNFLGEIKIQNQKILNLMMNLLKNMILLIWKLDSENDFEK